jgi:hypothetical protein
MRTRSTIPRIDCREYKMMLDPRPFREAAGALEMFWDDVQDLASALGVGVGGQFDLDKVRHRTITFLDTPDNTLHANGLILRRRGKQNNGKTEYTLKCRDADRYVATGWDVRGAEGLNAELKFEEDIGVPFVSRFSRSGTVSLEKSNLRELGKKLRTLGEAAMLFPVLRTLTRDCLPCPIDTELRSVNPFKVHELVCKGPELAFTDPDDSERSKRAEVALILWRKEKNDRPVAAEFSFRYSDANEDFSSAVALAAKRLFLVSQQLDWARPEALTKTQYVYKTAGG